MDRAAAGGSTSLHLEGRPFEPPQFVAGNLMLIAQEAVRTAVNHARAKTVRVGIAYAEAVDAITVTVDDDGSGFAIDAVAGGHFSAR